MGQKESIESEKPKRTARFQAEALKSFVAQTPLAAADLVSTKYALDHNPQTFERNPLMSDGKRLAVKGLTTAGIAGLAGLAAHKDHPNLAKVLTALGIIGNGYLAINNLRKAERGRR